MNKDLGDEMVRWRDRSPHGGEAEDRAADLIRGSLAPGQPDSLRLLHVEQSLRGHRRSSSPLVLRLALVVVALVACVATVKAYEVARRSGWLKRAQPPLPASVPAASPASSSRARSLRRETIPPALSAVAGPTVAAEATPETTGAAPSLASASVRRAPVSSESPRSRPRARPVQDLAMAAAAAGSPGAVGAPDGPRTGRAPKPVVRLENPVPAAMPAPVLAPAPAPMMATTSRPAAVTAAPASLPASLAASPPDEVRSLDHALALLRREHHGEAALSALDAYLGRYPNGVLNREARFARVDALLMLGRSEDALAALDGLPLDRGRRSTELQVIRGELRARHDCLHAEADFSAALAQTPSAGLLERILYGRGVCRVRVGNRAAGAADLERYLGRFPAGAHASSARQWLQSAGKESHPQNQP